MNRLHGSSQRGSLQAPGAWSSTAQGQGRLELLRALRASLGQWLVGVPGWGQSVGEGEAGAGGAEAGQGQ